MLSQTKYGPSSRTQYHLLFKLAIIKRIVLEFLLYFILLLLLVFYLIGKRKLFHFINTIYEVIKYFPRDLTIYLLFLHTIYGSVYILFAHNLCIHNFIITLLSSPNLTFYEQKN